MKNPTRREFLKKSGMALGGMYAIANGFSLPAEAVIKKLNFEKSSYGVAKGKRVKLLATVGYADGTNISPVVNGIEQPYLPALFEDNPEYDITRKNNHKSNGLIQYTGLFIPGTDLRGEQSHFLNSDLRKTIYSPDGKFGKEIFIATRENPDNPKNFFVIGNNVRFLPTRLRNEEFLEYFNRVFENDGLDRLTRTFRPITPVWKTNLVNKMPDGSPVPEGDIEETKRILKETNKATGNYFIETFKEKQEITFLPQLNNGEGTVAWRNMSGIGGLTAWQTHKKTGAILKVNSFYVPGQLSGTKYHEIMRYRGAGGQMYPSAGRGPNPTIMTLGSLRPISKLYPKDADGLMVLYSLLPKSIFEKDDKGRIVDRTETDPDKYSKLLQQTSSLLPATKDSEGNSYPIPEYRQDINPKETITIFGTPSTKHPVDDRELTRLTRDNALQISREDNIKLDSVMIQKPNGGLEKLTNSLTSKTTM